MIGIEAGVSKQLDDKRASRNVSEKNALILVERNLTKAVDEHLKQEGAEVRGSYKPEKSILDPTVAWTGFCEGITIRVQERVDAT